MNSEELERKQKYQWLLKQMKQLEKHLDLLDDQHQLTRSQVEKNAAIDQHIAFDDQFETIQGLEQDIKQRLMYEIIPTISKNL